MRTLLVMRHAKSDWSTAAPDHERPLNARGRRDASAAGGYLGRYRIDRLLCSTAERTFQTWQLASRAGASATAVDYRSEIYEAAVGDLLELLRELPDEVGTAMLLGHFPGVADLVERLAIPDDNPAWTAMAIKYPTSAIAVLEFDLAWPQLRARKARLVDYQVPRG